MRTPPVTASPLSPPVVWVVPNSSTYVSVGSPMASMMKPMIIGMSPIMLISESMIRARARWPNVAAWPKLACT